MRPIQLWAPVVFWCLAIFAFSSIPDLSSGLAYDFPLRKAAHMAEYGILFLLSRRAARGTWGRAPRWSWAAALFCVLYAMTDEFHQSFVAGRLGCWADVAVDSAGTVLAAGLTKLRGEGIL